MIDEAEARTGMTPQLRRAAHVMQELASLPPEMVEELFKAVGQMEGNGTFEVDEYEISC